MGGHVAPMGDEYAYIILAGNSKGKRYVRKQAKVEG
jgi:hypothetical protein